MEREEVPVLEYTVRAIVTCENRICLGAIVTCANRIFTIGITSCTTIYYYSIRKSGKRFENRFLSSILEDLLEDWGKASRTRSRTMS